MNLFQVRRRLSASEYRNGFRLRPMGSIKGNTLILLNSSPVRKNVTFANQLVHISSKFWTRKRGWLSELNNLKKILINNEIRCRSIRRE